jgi:single-strand DNA-binding protein
MASYNKITLVGNVGRDPELKVVGNSKVVDFSIAINEPARGQNPEKTEWYRVSFWDRKAEIIAQYVKKGTQILVEGRLSVRTYLDNTQKERYSLEVSGLDFVLLGSKVGGEESEAAGAFQRRESGQSAPATSAPVAASSPVSLPSNSTEDDLPF